VDLLSCAVTQMRGFGFFVAVAGGKTRARTAVPSGSRKVGGHVRVTCNGVLCRTDQVN